LIEPTSPRTDAATAIFNLPDYRVTGTEILAFGQRRIHVDATAEAGCPSCGGFCLGAAALHYRRTSPHFQT
jgi:transposase